MSHWITIYLNESLNNLNTEEIKLGINDSDWYTLSEEFGVNEDEVDEFMTNLIWNNTPLQIGLKDKRPLQIHIWNSKNRVIEELDELNGTKLPELVTKHLESVKTVIAIELGEQHLNSIYEVVAFEVAYWLAETKKGLIKSQYDLWFDHNKYRWNNIK